MSFRSRTNTDRGITANVEAVESESVGSTPSPVFLFTLATLLASTTFFFGYVVGRSSHRNQDYQPNSIATNEAAYDPPRPAAIGQPTAIEPPTAVETSTHVEPAALVVADPAPVKVVPPPIPRENRFWVDSTGKHTTRAALIEIRGESAYLQKEDGRLAAVPIRRLSQADREYVTSLHTDKIITGKVVGVTDGDTITVRGDDTYKIRLEGIDAPESGQDFGTKAKQALSEKVFGKTVTIEWKEKDKYGRTLGHVIADGNWVNKQLVDDGFAWHYKEYNSSAVLADAETKAKAASLGLWRDKEPTPPWVFRHPPMQPRAPPVASNPDTNNWWANDPLASDAKNVPINSFASGSRPAATSETVYISSVRL